MQTLVGLAAVAAAFGQQLGCCASAAAGATTAPVDPASIRTVHMVFSHHLDVGLDLPLKITADCVGFGTKIVQRYFDDFIPRALFLAEQVGL